LTQFFKGLEDGGLQLEEKPVIPHNHVNDANMTWDEFPVKHTRESKMDELDLSIEPGTGVC
jgi:hypothetical protein